MLWAVGDARHNAMRSEHPIKKRKPYEEEYPKGSRVKIASRPTLEKFLRDWKYHNKLQPEQLNYADQFAEVESIGFYHGGDELYKLQGIPGLWHLRCLLPVSDLRAE
jgi:hypothetical protein